MLKLDGHHWESSTFWVPKFVGASKVVPKLVASDWKIRRSTSISSRPLSSGRPPQNEKKLDFHHWSYDLHMTFKWLLTFKMSFKPKKQWQILNVCFLIFPMIYNMSVKEKVDFLSFFKYELQNGVKMTLKPKNNYIFLKHKLSAFQWYITCHDIRKLIFCHFWCTRASKMAPKAV